MQYGSRDIAVLALRDRGGNVSAHLDRLLAGSRLGDADRSLARELSLGVLRRRGTLDVLLEAFLERPDRKLPGSLKEILQVGLYQILFMDRVPDFAAVNEAVQQAVEFRHRRQSGLVNGLLRSIIREVSPVEPGTPAFSQDVLAVSPDSFRKFARGVFPDPQSNPAEYLAAAYSLPESLAGRWLERFGPDKTAHLGMHANTRAPLVMRVNRLRSDVAGVLAKLADDGVEAIAHTNERSVVLCQGTDVTKLAVFRDGLVQPQDATATDVAVIAAPRAGMRVLDFCASPGTKTTHLAELMDNKGEIVAVDVSADKLARIEDNCKRLGVSIVTTRLADAAGSLEPESFDLVLADVPCSNTGVLARRPEARWRFDLDKFGKLIADQRIITTLAAGFAHRGGKVVYSTCSIEPEECSQVAGWLEKRCNLKMSRDQLTLPGGAQNPAKWHDGGYIAVFGKK